MTKEKPHWRVKRKSCTYYVPYPQPIARAGRFQIKGVERTGRCVLKNLPETGWFSCRECEEQQEREGFQIHIINEFTITARPHRHNEGEEFT
jgi:hypothetical protein